MRLTLKHWLIVGSLATIGAACGSAENEEKGSPPPVVKGQRSASFALEDGEYYMEQIRDLQDGCGKKPLEGDDPITLVPFNLTNDGNGTVSIDFCSYDNTSTRGQIRQNRGTLFTLHQLRKEKNGDDVAEFAQECRLSVKVTADNTMAVHYVENQRNRNDVMQLATQTFAEECVTSFDFVLKKK